MSGFRPGDPATIHRPRTGSAGFWGHGKEGTVRWVEERKGFPAWVGLVDEDGGLWPVSETALRKGAE